MPVGVMSAFVSRNKYFYDMLFIKHMSFDTIIPKQLKAIQNAYALIQ